MSPAAAGAAIFPPGKDATAPWEDPAAPPEEAADPDATGHPLSVRRDRLRDLAYEIAAVRCGGKLPSDNKAKRIALDEVKARWESLAGRKVPASITLCDDGELIDLLLDVARRDYHDAAMEVKYDRTAPPTRRRAKKTDPSLFAEVP